jgi:hypothetical protein
VAGELTRRSSSVNPSGWLIVLGSVAAAVGVTLFGMGTSTLQADEQLVNYGTFLTVGGLIALAIGFVAYKATEPSDTV